MPDSTAFEIDLDNEKVFVDNQWMSRGDLANLLSRRLASMDFNIAKLSSAIEQLDQTLNSLETMSVKLTPEVAVQLKEAATRLNLPVGAVVREAVVSYLVGAALSKLG